MKESPEQEPQPSEIWHARIGMLRREAGEEEFGKPDPKLFGFILAREAIVDSITATGISTPPPEGADDNIKSVWEAYLAIGDEIKTRRIELELDPPSSQA